MIRNYDIFFFDFDGLLVNTEELHYKAYCETLKQRGCDFATGFDEYAAIALTSSDGLRKKITSMFPQLEAEWNTLYQEKKERYQELLSQGTIELMPGVEEFLSRLDTRRRCVVTNSTKQQVEAIKQKLPVLQSIPWWITREDYEKAKPAPDGYLVAKQRHAKKDDRMVGFEDSLRGVQSLQAAGIEPVLVGAQRYPQLSEIKHAPTFHHLI